MRIGIDIRTLMDRRYSGVSEYTKNLTKKIIELDKHDQYVLYYNSFRDVRDSLPDFNYDNAVIENTNYPNKIFNYVLQKTFNRPRIDRLLKVDLFFMPHINFISLSNRVDSIITVHDLSYLRFKEFFSFRKNAWHYLINTKKLLRKFKRIVAVSEHTKKDLIELLDVPEEKISVIHSGIDKGFFKEASPEEKRRAVDKYRLPGQYIFYLGNIEPRKNVDGIIRAYGELINKQPELSCYRLLIGGNIGWKAKNIIKEKAGSAYKDKIRFLGYIDQADKKALYSLASLFVYPSYYEGFGFPPLEAMASGCPAIVSTNSSLPEITAGRVLSVNSNNINECAKAMAILLKDDQLRAKTRKQAGILAQRYNWELSARKYINLWRHY